MLQRCRNRYTSINESNLMPFKLIEKQIVYDGKKLRLELHHLMDENDRRTVREVVAHNGAVVILPFVTDRRIVMLRQRRYAVGQVLLELPAGTLERDELPMNCAGRELVEETGYLAGRLKPLSSFFSSPGILSEKMHAFVAYDLVKHQQALEEGEDIELAELDFTEAIEMIRHGQIQDAKSIATLLMYDRFNRDRE